MSINAKEIFDVLEETEKEVQQKINIVATEIIKEVNDSLSRILQFDNL